MLLIAGKSSVKYFYIVPTFSEILKQRYTKMSKTDLIHKVPIYTS